MAIKGYSTKKEVFDGFGKKCEPSPANEYTVIAIKRTCDEIKDMLVAKNTAYGDSALSPVRVFSQADPIEQLRVRIDDKLSRVMRGQEAGEDVILDLIGYLVLLLIGKRNAA